MAYPRTQCHLCERDTAIAPQGQHLYRHDPAGGRTPDLKSCPGSFSHAPLHHADELTLFDVEEDHDDG